MEQKTKTKAPSFYVRNGNTTFEVNVHFNSDAKETFDEKITKLIKADIDNEKFDN